MPQTKQRNQWRSKVKSHIGADVNETEQLLHGGERCVLDDDGSIGPDQRKALKGRPVKWRIDMNRGRIKAIAEDTPKKPTGRAERLKAQICDRFEHRCYMVKNLFDHRKVCHQALNKNTATCFTRFARANLALGRKDFLA